MSAAWLDASIGVQRIAIVRAALDNIGVSEMPRGSNRSPTIDGWNTSVGAPLASPWCASFASCCLSFGSLGFASASCEDWHQWAIAHRRWIIGNPVPGDLILFSFDNSGRADHCGIVVRVDSGYCLSVEGNTNSDGGREGWGVLLHDRSQSKPLGFVSAS